MQLPGNLLSAYILHYHDLDLKPAYHQLISSLIWWDMALLVLQFLLYSLRNFSLSIFDTIIFPHVAPILFPLAQIALQGSIYTTIAVTTERYLAICHSDRTW